MDKGSNTYTIHVKFAFEQTVLLQWELDAYTADHIIAITDATERVKYRLSLQSYFNAIQNHHYSYITKYDHGISEKIMFPCSESYTTKISSLREVESLDVLSLPSSTPLQLHISGLQDEEPIESKGITPLQFRRGLKPTVTRIFVSMLIIAMLSFIYIPEFSYISEKVFANVVIAPKLTEQALVEPKVTTEKLNMVSYVPMKDPIIPSSATTEPSAITEPLAPPTVNLDKEVNFNVPHGAVSITFDDGPSTYTQDIVNVLKKYNVGGTFFFVGTQVRKFPEAVEYVDANGFSIGNHSMTHANLAQLSASDQQYQLEQTNQLIQNITSKPVLLFRPPYGSRDDTLDQLVSKNNMKMVLWNNDPEDWNHSNSQKILNYITHTKSTGSIILLHESKETLKALPLIIEFLQKQQLEISSLL